MERIHGKDSRKKRIYKNGEWEPSALCALRKKLTIECDAVSEILGLVFMVAIATVALSGTAAVIFSSSGPDPAPHIDLQEWVNTSSDVLYVKHGGGDLIGVDELEFIVNVNGNRHIFTSSDISEALEKTTLEPGDIVTVDMRDKWGLCLKNEDSLDVYMVFRDSKEVIQKASIPLEGMCRPVMHLNTWYFFTRVEGKDREGVDLEFFKNYDPDVDLTVKLEEGEHDKYLGKDEKEYFSSNPYESSLKKDPLDLTFGFNETDFKGFRSPPQNATILMIYRVQASPVHESLGLTGRELPDFNPPNSGNKKWFLYNRTIEVDIDDVSDLEFNIQAITNGNKAIWIDYLAVRLS